MNVGEELRALLDKLGNKDLAPEAFHLMELISTIPATADLNELEIWEYKVGEDVLKLSWELEDFVDIIIIYLNSEIVYCTQCSIIDSLEYDDDAEDLFLFIIKHGAVLQPQSVIDYATYHLDDDILEKHRIRRMKSTEIC